MALTVSNIFEKGKLAPDFNLLDSVSNSNLSLKDLKGKKETVIMFICNHCPFVIHVNHRLVTLANDYLSKGISFIAINSNDVVHYPQDGLVYIKKVAQDLNYPFQEKDHEKKFFDKIIKEKQHDTTI
jgi:thiol-disulfide isomerase/thioredoxin